MRRKQNTNILVGGTKRDRIRLESNVAIDRDNFELAQEFFYLGFLLKANNNVSYTSRTKCTMYKQLIPNNKHVIMLKIYIFRYVI